jgi:hypothetical protein
MIDWRLHAACAGWDTLIASPDMLHIFETTLSRSAHNHEHRNELRQRLLRLTGFGLNANNDCPNLFSTYHVTNVWIAQKYQRERGGGKRAYTVFIPLKGCEISAR